MQKLQNLNLTTNLLLSALIAVAMVAMSFVIVNLGVSFGFVVAFIPAVILLLIAILKNPYWGFVTLFFLNYFIVPIIRYSYTDGLSVMVDVVLVLTIVSLLMRAFFTNSDTSPRARFFNGSIVIAIVWTIYCCMEVMNPTALTGAWLYSRGLIYYFLLMSGLTVFIFRNYRDVEQIIMLLSVFTLLGVAKALMQEYMGFDAAEQTFLNEGSYKTHLLASGTRYFSIFASAGIFGAAMGHAFVVYSILAIFVKSKARRVYFIFVALAAFYGLIISGTRGTLAIPAAGFMLFVLLSKQIKVIVPTAILCVVTYVFLAMTTIGQSNAHIRRMRTVFDPKEPSLMVRKDNQKKLGEYLVNRPFGEGLGLSGVEGEKFDSRFTTSIPTDSWYVKIWVETGIVGLILYIAMMVYLIVHGSCIVFFQIKNAMLKAMLTALLCGVFGIMVSSYGNLVLGQFPIVLITYMSITLVFMGPFFDKQMSEQGQSEAGEG